MTHQNLVIVIFFVQVRSAWIGPRPSSVNKDALSSNLVTNSQFKSWLSKHKLSEEEFLDCIKGERPQKAFFPFQSSEVLSAKILAFDDPGPKGVQCGVLLITKGSLEKQTVIFESNSVFLHCKKVACKLNCQIS